MTQRTHAKRGRAKIFEIDGEIIVGKRVVLGHFVHSPRDFVLFLIVETWKLREDS